MWVKYVHVNFEGTHNVEYFRTREGFEKARTKLFQEAAERAKEFSQEVEDFTRGDIFEIYVDFSFKMNDNSASFSEGDRTIILEEIQWND
jgi:hypothetical protein